MYEMYPDAWGSDDHAHPAEAASPPVRRRVRREHRIQPVVAESAAAGRPRSTDDLPR